MNFRNLEAHKKLKKKRKLSRLNIRQTRKCVHYYTCVCYIRACASIVTSIKEDRLGQAPILGQYVNVCAPIPLGSGSI